MIDKKTLTPVFKKVIKSYMKDVKKEKWSIHDITEQFTQYSINYYFSQNKRKKTMIFTITDIQELVLFITIAERMLFGRK